MKNPIIVITGPTASGKTVISFPLAKKFGGEIIAADSMTVYKGMDIGTDKPILNQKPLPDRQAGKAEIPWPSRGNGSGRRKDGNFIIHGIPHHLIDVLDPDEEFNVSIFKKMAEEKIAKIQKRGKIPFIVGGSTMYIDGLVYDYQIPAVEPDQKLRNRLEKQSNETLYKKLLKLDPDAEWTIDQNNKRRLVRALEVTLKSHTPFSKQKLKKEMLPNNVLYLAVEKNRETLYKKINSRVDVMFHKGFAEEVQKLFPKYDHNTAMQAAGYRQVIEFLEGKIKKEEAIEKTKQIHRNYAKRQLTWLRKNKDITWIKNTQEAEREIKNFLKN